MDILLTNSYFLHEDPAELQIMKPFPPLGLLAISAYLKEKGFAVEVIDNTFSTKDDFSKYLAESQPKIVGISINMMTKFNALAIIQECKARDCIVIVGGPDPPYYAEEYLQFGADVVVIGEGEETLEELIPLLKNGKTDGLTNVAGIVYRDADGTIHRTDSRPLIKDLDSLPFPDRESISVEKYLKTWRTHHGFGPVSVITSRGCPYSCTWCSHSVFGKSLSKRSPHLVADEIQMLIQRYQPDSIWYADDVFNIDHKWLFKFAVELQSRKIKIPFDCTCRADRMNEKVMDTLHRMGCKRIWFGSESGSQRLLDTMKRGVKAEKVQQITQLAREFGIETGMFLMWGFEDENFDDIRQTIEHVKISNPNQVLTTISYPIKGTEYYQRMNDLDLIVHPKDWTKSNDRSFGIKGRRSKRYYDFVNKWLYSEIDLLQAKANGQSVLHKAKSKLNILIGKVGMALTSLHKLS